MGLLIQTKPTISQISSTVAQTDIPTDVVEFAFCLISTPPCGSTYQNWCWDRQQVYLLSQYLCQLGLQCLTRSFIQWRLGEISPLQIEPNVRQSSSLRILETALANVIPSDGILSDQIISNRSSNQSSNQSSSIGDRKLDMTLLSVDQSITAVDVAINLATRLLRMTSLDQIHRHDFPIFRELAHSTAPMLQCIIAQIFPEWEQIINPTVERCTLQCAYCDRLNIIDNPLPHEVLASPILGSSSCGDAEEIERRCRSIWVGSSKPHTGPRSIPESTNRSTKSDDTHNSRNTLDCDNSVDPLDTLCDIGNGTSRLIEMLMTFTATEIPHDFHQLALRDDVLCAHTFIPLLLFKGLLIRSCHMGTVLTSLATTFLSLSRREQKRRKDVMRLTIMGVIGLRTLFYKGKLILSTQPILNEAKSSRRNLLKRENSMESLNRISSMPFIWKTFWNELDVLKIAEAALYSDLCSESQLLTQIHCQQKHINSFSPLSSESLFRSSVPPEVALLVASSHQLGIGLPDAYHGAFASWLSPDVLLREAEVAGRHWRRLAFINSPLTPPTSDIYSTSPSADTSCLSLVVDNCDVSWRQRVGLPFAIPKSNTEAMFEQLWRLSQWDTAEELFYENSEMGFHQGVFECFDRLRRTSILGQSSVANGGSVHDLTGRLVRDSVKLDNRESNKDDMGIVKPNISYRHRADLTFRNDEGNDEGKEDLENITHHLREHFSDCTSPMSLLHHLIRYSMVESLDQWNRSNSHNDRIVDIWIHQYRDLCDVPSLLTLFEPLLLLRRILLRLTPSDYDPLNLNSLNSSLITENSSSTFPTLTSVGIRPSTSTKKTSTEGMSSTLELSSKSTKMLEMELIDCRALGLEGLHDAAVIRSLSTLRELEKLKTTGYDTLTLAAQWQSLRGFWEAGDQRRTLLLGQRLASQLCSSFPSPADCPYSLEFKSQIIATVGQWTFEAQTEPIDKIEELFLKPSSMMCQKATSTKAADLEFVFIGPFKQFEALRIYAAIMDETLQVCSYNDFVHSLMIRCNDSVVKSTAYPSHLSHVFHFSDFSRPSHLSDLSDFSDLVLIFLIFLIFLI